LVDIENQGPLKCRERLLQSSLECSIVRDDKANQSRPRPSVPQLLRPGYGPILTLTREWRAGVDKGENWKATVPTGNSLKKTCRNLDSTKRGIAIRDTTNSAAIAMVTGKANRRAEDLREILATIERDGSQTLSETAAALNNRGIATPRGGRWYRP
jgi:hypothetical protein